MSGKQIPIWNKNKRMGFIHKGSGDLKLIFFSGSSEKGREMSFQLNQIITYFLKENNYTLGFRMVERGVSKVFFKYF